MHASLQRALGLGKALVQTPSPALGITWAGVQRPKLQPSLPQAEGTVGSNQGDVDLKLGFGGL